MKNKITFKMDYIISHDCSWSYNGKIFSHYWEGDFISGREILVPKCINRAFCQGKDFECSCIKTRPMN